MRLLIAENDARLLKSLVHVFESNNYMVDGVSNGEDALDYELSGEYDGLVLDIMMPGMDGIAVLKKLRSSGITTPARFPTTPTSFLPTSQRETLIKKRKERLWRYSASLPTQENALFSSATRQT